MIRTCCGESVHAGGLAGPSATAAAAAARQVGHPAVPRQLLLHVQRQLRHLISNLGFIQPLESHTQGCESIARSESGFSFEILNSSTTTFR